MEIAARAPALKDALAYLGSIASRLRFYGFAAAVLTLANLANYAYSLVLQGQSSTLFVTVSVGITVFAFFSLAMHERSRKLGDALFEEISDELEWDLRAGQRARTERKKAAEERPDLSYRLALRRFVQSADLPLAPFASGAIVYAVINLLCFLATVLTGRIIGP
ncbi:MAG: hypothetical protein D6696_11795 [Acidobacteria bacterium]|nr:MAG: hypothetical protein D6696_11795 [Acidobacteriota bacterium]